MSLNLNIITIRTISADFYEYIWKTVCINSYDYDYIYTYTNNVTTTVYNSNTKSNEIVDDNDDPATELARANELDNNIDKSNSYNNNNYNSSGNNSPKVGHHHHHHQEVSVKPRDIEFNGLESLDDTFLSYLDNPPELQAVNSHYHYYHHYHHYYYQYHIQIDLD